MALAEVLTVARVVFGSFFPNDLLRAGGSLPWFGCIFVKTLMYKYMYNIYIYITHNIYVCRCIHTYVYVDVYTHEYTCTYIYTYEYRCRYMRTQRGNEHHGLRVSAWAPALTPLLSTPRRPIEPVMAPEEQGYDGFLRRVLALNWVAVKELQ